MVSIGMIRAPAELSWGLLVVSNDSVAVERLLFRWEWYCEDNGALGVG